MLLDVLHVFVDLRPFEVDLISYSDIEIAVLDTARCSTADCRTNRAITVAAPPNSRTDQQSVDSREDPVVAPA